MDIMKSLIRNVCLTIGLAVSIGGFAVPSSFGIAPPAGDANSSATSPNIANIGPVVSGPTVAGLDGNLRLVFNIFGLAGAPPATALTSANLWVVSPTGSVLTTFAGLPIQQVVPTGPGFPVAPPGTPQLTPVLVQGQVSGNTTIAFLLPPVPTAGPATAPTTLGVWTLNSAGTIISITTAGPFVVTEGGVTRTYQIEDAEWNQSTGKLIVKWASADPVGSRSYSVWVVNEFGGLETAFGPIGPFVTGAILSKAVLLKNGNVHLVWDTPSVAGVPPSTTTHTTSLWVVNPAGQITSVANFGPF